MNKRQASRLLNVARALREYEHPERFSMDFYLHGDEFAVDIQDEIETKKEWCGTPGCALGTFASRPDLQRLLTVERHEDGQPYMAFRGEGEEAYYDTEELQDYFGIEWDEAIDLFSSSGCGGATTPISAANYIDKFVHARLNEG